MAATLSRATIEAVTDDLITLRMPDTTGGEALKRSLDTLRKAVEGVIGRPIDVRVMVGGAGGFRCERSGGGRRISRRASRRRRALRVRPASLMRTRSQRMNS